MKEVYISLILILGAANFSFTQNLIPNGDFELGPDSLSYAWSWWLDSNCVNDTPMPGPDYWTVTNITPDRMVDTDPQFPTSCRDTTFAQSGNAYIVLVADVVGNDEAGKTTLITSLQKDSVYRLSYYLSVQTAGNQIIYPAAIQFHFNNGGNTIFSPVVNTTSWQYFDTVFVASANSTEMEVAYASVIAGAGAANIDNIQLVKEPITSISVANFNPPMNKIKIYPNPTTGIFHINSNEETVSINFFDAVGQKIDATFSMGNNSYQFNFSHLAKGLYFIQLRTEKRTYIEKLFIH